MGVFNENESKMKKKTEEDFKEVDQLFSTQTTSSSLSSPAMEAKISSENHGIRIQIQVRSFYQVSSILQSENIEEINNNQTLEVIYRSTFGIKIESGTPIDISTISDNTTGTLLFQLKNS